MSESLVSLKRNLNAEIQELVNSTGILCKVFSRIKDPLSLKKKLEKIDSNGNPHYSKDGKKLQDIIGFRLVTYFHEDVELLWLSFKKKYQLVDESTMAQSTINFEPVRKNMVLKVPDKYNLDLSDVNLEPAYLDLIDHTFEIQFRTVLSEGWHEIDHALRYKSKDEWVNYQEESRMLNGIYATLETSDRALKSLFDDLAYKHYKANEWEAMLRTKYRLHFEHMPLKQQLKTLFDEDHNLVKNIYKAKRETLLMRFIDSKLKMRISLDNIVYLQNYLVVCDQKIYDLMPQNIKQDFATKFGAFQPK